MMTKSLSPDELLAQIANNPTSSPVVDKSKGEDNATQKKAQDRRKWRSFYSDMELADRFSTRVKHIAFVSDYDHWMLYNVELGVWERVHEQVVRGLIQDFLVSEYEEAASARDAMRLDAAEVCQRALTSKRILDWITPSASVAANTFDTHKDLIVVANGVVDLRTSKLSPFDPDLYFTKRIAYPYEAGVRNKWTEAAIASLPDDCHDQFKVMAGQALTGHQPSRSTIFFLWGDGSNGKSTLIDLLSTTAGDFGGRPPKKVLLKGSESNFHLIKFKGLRQALIEELPDERFLDGGVVRDLAGTETMSGEFKGKDVEEFEVQATIFITFNNRPQVSETARGVWRRLKLFPFPFTYVESQGEVRHEHQRLQNAMLKDLHKKSDKAVIAFLAWRVEGARLWYEAGMKDPEDAPSVVDATRQWRISNDVMEHWFEENLVADPDCFVLVDDLLDDFNQWRNTPRAAWGKHNLLDKFATHSVFQDNGLEYRRTARHKNLTQSQWASDRAVKEARRQQRIEENVNGQKPPLMELLDRRVAKLQATFVSGVRFRDSADELEVPDTVGDLGLDAVDVDFADDVDLDEVDF